MPDVHRLAPNESDGLPNVARVNSKISPRIARCLAVAVAGALAVGGAVATVAPASASVPKSPIQSLLSRAVIPFTTATVTAGAPGTWTINWSAPRVRNVEILTGTSSKTIRQLAGHGAGSGSITVTSTATRPWFELVPDEGAPLVIASRDLGLASDANLRDAGGYRTTDGQWVRSGVAYRSAALTLSPADAKVVNTLGITSDIDFRTTSEVAAAPDVVPTGATYISANVLGTSSTTGYTAPTSAADARQLMITGEQGMVTLPSAQAAYRTYLNQLAASSSTVLYHCTAGKDRTGWASAVLLSLLGVPQSTIMQDYLLSNTYDLDSPAYQAELAAMPPAQAAIYEPLLAVDASYLNAGFDQVKTSYGSMYNYAVKGLHISPLTILKLRAKFLEGAPSFGN